MQQQDSGTPTRPGPPWGTTMGRGSAGSGRTRGRWCGPSSTSRGRRSCPGSSLGGHEASDARGAGVRSPTPPTPRFLLARSIFDNHWRADASNRERASEAGDVPLAFNAARPPHATYAGTSRGVRTEKHPLQEARPPCKRGASLFLRFRSAIQPAFVPT